MPHPEYGDWPTLSEAELAIFSGEMRQYLENEQKHVIVANRMTLQDILENCKSRPQFAKTFRLLRRDKRRTLEKWRGDLNRTMDATGQALILATMQMYDRVISYKLGEMATFFHSRWGEDIEAWAGKELGLMDRIGCLLFLVFSFTTVIVLGWFI